MAKFISEEPNVPEKTSLQCKSFDQRMKDQTFLTRSEGMRQMDLLESSIDYLSKTGMTASEREIIRKYVSKMETKSVYINFL